MDKKESRTAISTVESVKISYKGISARNDAEFLHREVSKQWNINVPAEIQVSAAALGVAEIFIAIVVATITKTTLMAILEFLEKYFAEDKKLDDTVSIQIIIKRDDSDAGRHFPLRAGAMKQKALKILFSEIRQYISRASSREKKN